MEFEDHLLAHELSKKTIKQYLKHFRLFLVECPVITQPSINKFVKNHPTYVNRAFLKHLFEWIEQNKILEKHEIPKIQKPQGFEQRLPKDLYPDVYFDAIRKHLLKNNHYKFVLMYDISDKCGLRREEAVEITFNSFYWDIWERDQGLRLKVYAKGKERIVSVPPKIAERILKYCDKYKAETPAMNKPLFKVGISRWHQVFKKASEKATEGKDINITLHDLRRRRATKWLESGIDLDEVRRRLGHSNINTTQKYLLRNEEERLKKWESSYE